MQVVIVLFLSKGAVIIYCLGWGGFWLRPDKIYLMIPLPHCQLIGRQFSIVSLYTLLETIDSPSVPPWIPRDPPENSPLSPTSSRVVPKWT